MFFSVPHTDSLMADTEGISGKLCIVHQHKAENTHHSWSWCGQHNRDKESIHHLCPQDLQDNVSRCLVTQSALLWDIIQHRMTIPYHSFSITYWSNLQEIKKSKNFLISWPLKMGPIDCPGTSVRYYYSMLCDIPEKGRSHLHCRRNLKSLKFSDHSHLMHSPLKWDSNGSLLSTGRQRNLQME